MRRRQLARIAAPVLLVVLALATTAPAFALSIPDEIAQQLAWVQSMHADMSAYLVALDLGLTSGIFGTGILSYEGTYEGALDSTGLLVGSYSGVVSGEFADLLLAATLSGGALGTLPPTTLVAAQPVGDTVYTLESEWNVFTDLAQPPLLKYEDKGTITIMANGSVAVNIDLKSKSGKPDSKLRGKDGKASLKKDGNVISGPTETPFLRRTIPSDATFTVDPKAGTVTSEIKGKGDADGYTIKNKGPLTVKARADGGAEGVLKFDIEAIGLIPWVPTIVLMASAIGLGGALVHWRRRRAGC